MPCIRSSALVLPGVSCLRLAKVWMSWMGLCEAALRACEMGDWEGRDELPSPSKRKQQAKRKDPLTIHAPMLFIVPVDVAYAGTNVSHPRPVPIRPITFMSPPTTNPLRKPPFHESHRRELKPEKTTPLDRCVPSSFYLIFMKRRRGMTAFCTFPALEDLLSTHYEKHSSSIAFPAAFATSGYLS